MKKYLIPFLTSIFLISCPEKVFYINVAPQLEIIVKTESCQLVSDAQVFLFLTENDWWDKTNAVQSGQTGSQGSIVFTELEEVPYYFYVTKDYMTNEGQVSEIKEALKENVKAIVETIIK